MLSRTACFLADLLPPGCLETAVLTDASFSDPDFLTDGDFLTANCFSAGLDFLVTGDSLAGMDCFEAATGSVH